MSITIFSQGRDVSPWMNAIKAARPELKVYIYPETGPADEVEFALAWNHPLGVFKQFPNLKCIASMGAGVDHILKDPDLPSQAVITRITDENLTRDMATFTLALSLNHLRNLPLHQAAEQSACWQPLPYLRPEHVTVGVMGMGVLGSYAAQKLKSAGFKVQGWARTLKSIEGISMFSGSEGLDSFLAASNILICLLPLTPETANILDADLFRKLPKGAFIINVARGEHLVEADLIHMIDEGHLAGAALDVFRKEPLPADHPFWSHPAIHVTPHIASVTDPRTAAAQVLDNYDRLNRQEPLQNIVSKTKGY